MVSSYILSPSNTYIIMEFSWYHHQRFFRRRSLVSLMTSLLTSLHTAREEELHQFRAGANIAGSISGVSVDE